MRGTRKSWKSVRHTVGEPLDSGNVVHGDTFRQRSITCITTARQTLLSEAQCATPLVKTCHSETVLPKLPGTLDAPPMQKFRQEHLRPKSNHRPSAIGGLMHCKP